MFYSDSVAEKLFELGRRTFDTPNFRGIEFIEVEAKSIINPVKGNYLPFNWTINPYRGCSHACVYCAGGDTPVLMGDGSTKPLAEVRKGDRVYGTRRQGAYRRYSVTEVLDHWETVKPAYRTTLADGTALITSGDHRFLTKARGWKYVTGSMHGESQRPYLTTNSELLGTGAFADPPKKDPDYRMGYLCGMLGGDANIGPDPARRQSGSPSTAHRFRLAFTDEEALWRIQEYLSLEDVDCTEFVFQRARPQRREMKGLRLHTSAGLAAIRKMIEWPDRPDEEWQKGFLAGIFDAEGSRSGHVLRISNTHGTILTLLRQALSHFAFRFVDEWAVTDSGKPICSVRFVGGLKEHLRFLHLVDPAITRKKSLEGIALKSKSDLRVVQIEELGVELPMFDISTGTGDFIMNGVVSHNCFARVTHTYMDMDAGRDFESKIVVKVNAPELLGKELRSKRWTGETIAMGTGTDPYQRAEGRYKLMPRIIETLTAYRNPFSILTKGTLILRDLPLLQEAASVTDVSTAFSIGTVDEKVWKETEPGTPHPRKRVEAMAKLNQAGVPCGVLVAPILPGLSDSPEQLKEVVEAVIDAGATHVSTIMLHLRPVVKDVFMEWLHAAHPELVPDYEDRYRRSAYGRKEERDALADQAGALIREAGGPRRPPPRPHNFRAGQRPEGPTDTQIAGQQLTLL